jgi:hypothetical protein
MNLTDWVKDELKNGVELWIDEKIVTQNGAQLKRNVKRLREICLGIISSNSPEEWYRLCRLNAPVGTVIVPYDEAVWTELFNDTTALVRNELTKALLKERAAKSAQTLLSVLQKRDKEHWSDNVAKKEVNVKTNEGTNVTFTVVE